MKVTSIKTEKVIIGKINLFQLLKKYLPPIKEKTIIVVTSKIVSICEGRVVKIGSIEKKKIIEQEADYYLPSKESKYNITFTIKQNLLIATAGIDESNGNGYYILWPSDPQKSANGIREYLQKTYFLRDVGVIITDSKTTPLKWGVTGTAIAHSGFLALYNYIGKPDIFGRPLEVTQTNIMEAMAGSAVLLMGEGDEQRPLAIIKDIPFVKFQNRNPSKEELNNLKISIEDDLYAPLLKSVNWLKGRAST